MVSVNFSPTSTARLGFDHRKGKPRKTVENAEIIENQTTTQPPYTQTHTHTHTHTHTQTHILKKRV